MSDITPQFLAAGLTFMDKNGDQKEQFHICFQWAGEIFDTSSTSFSDGQENNWWKSLEEADAWSHTNVRGGHMNTHVHIRYICIKDTMRTSTCVQKDKEMPPLAARTCRRIHIHTLHQMVSIRWGMHAEKCLCLTGIPWRLSLRCGMLFLSWDSRV